MPREGLLYDRTLLARLDHSRAGLRMSGGTQQCQGVGVVRAARDGGRDDGKPAVGSRKICSRVVHMPLPLPVAAQPLGERSDTRSQPCQPQDTFHMTLELGGQVVARAVGEREEQNAVRWDTRVTENARSHGQCGGLAAASARVNGDAGSWISSGHDLLVRVQPTQGVEVTIVQGH